MIMNAINFARSSGLTYTHTPFTVIHHADRPMEEWARAWETLFNLGAGEVVCETERREVVSYCHNFPALELCLGWSNRSDELARSFKVLIPEIRRKYYLNKSLRISDDVMIAVHIRRGDVLRDNPDRYTSSEAILRTITSVKQILDTQKIKYRISVYSQGKRADFGELILPGVEFFLDCDAVWTIQELIEADVLIMAKGCFSYCAGLISDGIKLFEPSGYPSMNSWISILADGSFDCANFKRRLSSLIRAKTVVI